MGTKENFKSAGAMYKAHQHKQENQMINDLTPISSPGADWNPRGVGVLESVGPDGSPMGSERMVELFLTKRRNEQGLGAESSPVFI